MIPSFFPYCVSPCTVLTQSTQDPHRTNLNRSRSWKREDYTRVLDYGPCDLGGSLMLDLTRGSGRGPMGDLSDAGQV